MAELSGRPARCRHADRQSRRHYPARVGDAGRRRPDRLRGHARHPQAARPLRHHHAADRPTTTTTPPRLGPRCCGAWPRARRSRWCRTPARRWFPTRATSLSRAVQEAGLRGHGAARALGATGGADASPACRPTSSSSPAFCRRSRPRGAPASPSSAASRRPSCCSRAGPGWPRRSPTSRPGSVREAPPFAAS